MTRFPAATSSPMLGQSEAFLAPCPAGVYSTGLGKAAWTSISSFGRNPCIPSTSLKNFQGSSCLMMTHLQRRGMHSFCIPEDTNPGMTLVGMRYREEWLTCERMSNQQLVTPYPSP